MSKLKNQRILMMGINPHSKVLASWLPTQGASVTIADPRNAGELADDMMEYLFMPDVSFALSNQGLELLDAVDMLCVSDSTPLDAPVLLAARERGIPIRNEVVLFMDLCDAQRIVGITGSLGKSSTGVLLKEMAERADFNVWGGDDIPLNNLDSIAKDDIVLLEMRPDHLELSTVSPTVGVMTNIMPAYAARYGSVDALARVLANVFHYQQADDLFVYNHDDMLSRAVAEQAAAEHASFSTRTLVPDGACLAGNRLIVTGICSPTNMAKVVCNVDEVALPGDHNMRNAVAASAIAGALGIPPEAIGEVLRTFKSIPHRLEIVLATEEIVWINDSAATSPDRVITSLNSFAQPVVLILGGGDESYNWGDLARLATERARAVVCYGENRERIADQMHRAHRMHNRPELDQIEIVDDLEGAVKMAAKLASNGDFILFSPGGTPDAQHGTLESRGDTFRELVEAQHGRKS
jgi:UDP-N-acetylmuramoylalanine--D-glutamate ligase